VVLTLLIVENTMHCMSDFPNYTMDSKLLEKLSEICGEEFVSKQHPDRFAYSRDMWPRSLIQQRSGKLNNLPDVVVWPEDVKQVAEVVRVAKDFGMPVVPFGAGSGVCAGTLPIYRGIILDLKRLNRIIQIRELDNLIEVQAGAIGENLERELNQRKFTLGHFPSSMYCSTVGGWIATRSAGQCSSRYGKIEDLVRSLRFVDAEGKIRDTSLYASSTDASFLEPLLVGSEGTLAIIVSATLVIRPLSPVHWFRGFRFGEIQNGLDAMRLILRQGLRPAVMRLYDEFDTVIAKTSLEKDAGESLYKQIKTKLSGSLSGVLDFSLKSLLQLPKVLNRMVDWLPSGCLLVVVAEGESAEREVTAEMISDLCLQQGASDLGEGPGMHWWEHRYSVSYKQSAIFSAGAFVDTMEVATTWDGLVPLYNAVKKSLFPYAFVMAHFSHAYREGCSIYFTFVAAGRDDSAAVKLYDRIWDKALETVLSQGGAISHHHGIGMSKRRFLNRQLDQANLLSQAVKKALDPQGLFNPGKLNYPNQRPRSVRS